MSFRVSRILCSLHELRLIFNSSQSGGAKSFLTSNFSSLKSRLPGVAILVRESPDAQSKAVGRFNGGVEREISLTNQATEKEWNEAVQELVKQGDKEQNAKGRQ
jgi:hypothetical protein